MKWSLIFGLDKWAHLAGSYMLTEIFMYFWTKFPNTSSIEIILIATMLGMTNELFQWRFKPDYIGKEFDTILDLIANEIGIVLAVILPF